MTKTSKTLRSCKIAYLIAVLYFLCSCNAKQLDTSSKSSGVDSVFFLNAQKYTKKPIMDFLNDKYYSTYTKLLYSGSKPDIVSFLVLYYNDNVQIKLYPVKSQRTYINNINMELDTCSFNREIIGHITIYKNDNIVKSYDSNSDFR